MSTASGAWWNFCRLRRPTRRLCSALLSANSTAPAPWLRISTAITGKRGSCSRIWASTALPSIPTVALLPSRFQPLDGKGGGIMSAIFLRDAKSPTQDDCECPWYWTKSDSDQDRPN